MVANLFDFRSVIEILEAWGLMDVLLPFFLIFTVTFAILQKTQILGAQRKNYNVIIGLVIALSVVVPHVLGSYPAGFDVVEIINIVIPQISLIIVAILMLLLMLGLFGGANIPLMAVFIALLFIIFIFLGTTEWLFGLDWLYDFVGTEVVSFLIVIIIFGLLIYFITKEPGGQKITNFISDTLKGIGLGK
jgi:hypothetical protein